MSQLTGGSVAEVPKMSVRLHCYWNKLGKRFLQCLTEKNANTKKKKKADERTQVATSSSTQHAATLVRRLLFRTRLRLQKIRGGLCHCAAAVRHRCGTRREAATHTFTRILLDSAGAQGQHRCAPGEIGGLAEEHVGSRGQSDIIWRHPSRYPCRMHAYISVINPLGCVVRLVSLAFNMDSLGWPRCHSTQNSGVSVIALGG